MELNRRWRSQWPSTFFGLKPEHKPHIHEEIFVLCYFGEGGFTHDEVYYMPIWLRKFYIKQIEKVKDKEKEEYEKAKGGSSNSGKIHRPNIPQAKGL